jgi:hypothetical protein
MLDDRGEIIVREGSSIPDHATVPAGARVGEDKN